MASFTGYQAVPKHEVDLSSQPSSSHWSDNGLFSREKDINTTELPMQIQSLNGTFRSSENAPKQTFVACAESKRQRFWTTIVAWVPELLCCLLSIASLVALVWVLRDNDGRLLEDVKLPYSLTLNGLVAALSTLNRVFLTSYVSSALMQEMWLFYAAEAQKKDCSSSLRHADQFDSASRGVFGSFIFLFRARGRRFWASLGCLIMILSLPFSTFMQQLISQHSTVSFRGPDNRHEWERKYLPDRLSSLESFYLSSGTAELNSPPLGMVAAIYNGILMEKAEPVPPKCPTGNCKWPLTPTLAVCGACVNSNWTDVKCEPNVCHNSTETKETENGPVESWSSSCMEKHVCNYTMPSGTKVSLVNNFTALDQMSPPDPFTPSDFDFPRPGFQSRPSRGAHFNRSDEGRSYLLNLDLIGVRVPGETGMVKDNTILATECALWFCVQVHEASFDETGYNWSTVSTFSDCDTTSKNWSAFQLPTSEADTLHTTQFSVDPEASESLSAFITAKMDGSVLIREHAQNYTNDMMLGVWNGTQNSTAWIENLALSISIAMEKQDEKSSSSNYAGPFAGTAYKSGVKIRWPWIALPVALVGASCLLLVAVIVRTAHSPIYSWKSSPLTLLLFEVDRSIREAVKGHRSDRRTLEKVVGHTRVRFRKNPSKLWEFQEYREE